VFLVRRLDVCLCDCDICINVLESIEASVS